MSVSEQWREKGNDLYRRSFDLTAPVLMKENLTKALNAYDQAVQTAISRDDSVSAHKNSAMAAWKLANLEDIFRLQYYYFKEALGHFTKALEGSNGCKSLEWQSSLGNSYDHCVRDTAELVVHSEKSSMERSRLLEECVAVMGDCQYKADIWIQIAAINFLKGIINLQGNEFKACLHAMQDCYFPIEEARRFARGRKEMLAQIETLETDVLMHSCMAESIQARLTGDNLLEQATKMEEELNIEMVWEVIDFYKKAILLTRELDVEMEAIALSRLGSLYHKVLKLKGKAKENLMRCMQLAHSLWPRTFAREDWFTECQTILSQYQQEDQAKEDKEHEAERAAYLEQLKEELAELKQHATDMGDNLLKFVYSTFPPKNKSHTMEIPKDGMPWEKTKKMLQKALLHYHPDKQDVTVYGMKWKVLCEEITKTLTVKYEAFK